MKILLTGFLFFFSSVVEAKNFFSDHARGWHWYEKMPIPEEQKENEKKKKGEASQSQTPSQIISSYREELENRLAKAWINPTFENIGQYQEMQKDMMNRSQNFSEMWMTNVFLDPRLDHTLVSPVNQKAVHVYMDEKRKADQNAIRELSKTHGLFFFYASNCSYCHQFAPIVKMFSEVYGWEVLAISLDGGKIDLFPQAVPDNGLAESWNVMALPSLFAVNPETEEVIPVAQGMASMDEMENRIMMLIRRRK